MRRLSKKYRESGIEVTEGEETLVLNDIDSWFIDDFCLYHFTKICELCSNLYHAIVEYLRPEYEVRLRCRDTIGYSYDIPAALIVPLNLIRSGSPGSFNIEDSITDLVKALDNLCAAHGLTTQNLFNRLENNNRERVSGVLDEARTTLVTIRSDLTSNGRQDQVDVVNVILSKIANAATASRDFGIAVKDLLKVSEPPGRGSSRKLLSRSGATRSFLGRRFVSRAGRGDP